MKEANAKIETLEAEADDCSVRSTYRAPVNLLQPYSSLMSSLTRFAGTAVDDC